jgi:hypothetical protein
MEKEQNSVPKKDHVMRKSPGNSFWVRALVFNLCKGDPPKLYKNAFATELDKIFHNA